MSDTKVKILGYVAFSAMFLGEILRIIQNIMINYNESFGAVFSSVIGSIIYLLLIVPLILIGVISSKRIYLFIFYLATFVYDLVNVILDYISFKATYASILLFIKHSLMSGIENFLATTFIVLIILWAINVNDKSKTQTIK